MKKFIYVTLSAVTLIFLGGCENDSGNNQGSVQIPNPFVNCETLKEAQDKAGFNLTLPDDLLSGYEEDAIRVMADEMIEISYRKGEDELYVRKAKGNEDISGDYNNYEEIEEIRIGERIVKTKGSQGKIYVGTYTVDNYSYSIGSTNGLDADLFKQLVEGIN